MVELEGRLFMSDSGFLLLSVPNALATGAFRALPYAGLELPRYGGRPFSAHITVMRPEEVESVGGPGVITERGRSFRYRIESLSEVSVNTQPYSKVWIYNVISPALLQLRKSYGLPTPMQPLHITVAARRRNVLYGNSIKKIAFAGELKEWAIRNRQAAATTSKC